MEIRDRIVELRRVPAKTLLPNPKNWRRHPEAQANALRALLADVGYAGALLARETVSGLELIDGHLRAETTPDADVPVLVLDVDEEEADRLLASMDPLAAMAETDPLALGTLLEGVSIENADLLAYLEAQMSTAKKVGRTDPDEVPELSKNPITRLGDVWHLGEHRVFCGDAQSSKVHRVLLGAERPDAILADPPYGIDLDTDYAKQGLGISNAVPQGHERKSYRKIHGDSLPFDAEFLRRCFSDVGEQFWFGANYYRRTLSESDLDGSWLVWDKRNEAADAYQGSGFELIWSAVRHKQDLLRIFWNGMFGSAEARERLHPTQKPVALLQVILDRWTKESSVILDPFLGSGSSLIAADLTGRLCYGIEIDPHYCDVVVARWEAFTGEKAVKADVQAA